MNQLARLLAFPSAITAILTLMAPLTAPQEANEDAVLTPTPTAAGDLFGGAVAVRGARALVGAESHEGATEASGAAFVLELQPNGSWLEVAELFALDGALGDDFGSAVSLGQDRALVGAIADDDLGVTSGSAYVFERQAGGTWLQAAKLAPLDLAAQDYFGGAVAVDGDRALVGAWGDDDGGSLTGSAYVFERQTDGSWPQVAKLHASAPALFDNFGRGVALQGERALIGAPYDDEAGFQAGAAYVCEHQGGGAWLEVAKLLPSGGPDPAGGRFGLVMSLDGDRALVGASLDDDAGDGAGAAYVFARQPDGSWLEEARLTAPDPLPHADFGSSVALAGDLALIGMGGDGAGAPYAGSAYLFERRSDATWQPVARLRASDLAENDVFGAAVGLADGHALVGAPGDHLGGSDAGSVYAFTLGTLYHGAPQLSLALGGTQDLLLRAGEDLAAHGYVLLGSASGTTPGTSIPGTMLTLPLVLDGYSLLLLNGGGAGLVVPFAGVLDAGGHADAALHVPTGLPPALVGTTLHHAFVTLDPVVLGLVEHASNATAVTLAP